MQIDLNSHIIKVYLTLKVTHPLHYVTLLRVTQSLMELAYA